MTMWDFPVPTGSVSQGPVKQLHGSVAHACIFQFSLSVTENVWLVIMKLKSIKNVFKYSD